MEFERAKRDTASLRNWKADIGRVLATGVLTVVALAVAGWPEAAAAAWITVGVAALAFVLVLAAEFGWNLLMAPGRIARDENARLVLEHAAQIAGRDAKIAELNAALDRQRPKLLLMQQLVRSDDLFPRWFAHYGATDEEREAQALKEATAIAEWDRRTRSILKKHAPQFRSQYTAGQPLPPGFFATAGLEWARAAPSGNELRDFLTQRREVLARIIRKL
jgi:hypothetical protein